MCIVQRCLYYIYSYTVLFVHLFVKVYGAKSLKIGRLVFQKPTMFSMSHVHLSFGYCPKKFTIIDSLITLFCFIFVF